MNTQEINGKNYIKTEEADGTILFTPVVEEVNHRKPQAGEVWSFAKGKNIFLVNPGNSATVLSGVVSWSCGEIYERLSDDIPLQEGRGTYKGKFHEVYVNRAEFIAEVRAALSHEDGMMDSYYKCIKGESALPFTSAEEKTLKALRKLNIITD